MLPADDGLSSRPLTLQAHASWNIADLSLSGPDFQGSFYGCLSQPQIKGHAISHRHTADYYNVVNMIGQKHPGRSSSGFSCPRWKVERGLGSRMGRDIRLGPKDSPEQELKRVPTTPKWQSPSVPGVEPLSLPAVRVRLQTRGWLIDPTRLFWRPPSFDGGCVCVCVSQWNSLSLVESNK